MAGVTHELRTPLAAIRLLAETLADGRGDPRDYGALVAQETERLESLVERVLSVARIDEAPHFAEVKPAGDRPLRGGSARPPGRAARGHPGRRRRRAARATWDGEAVRQGARQPRRERDPPRSRGRARHGARRRPIARRCGSRCATTGPASRGTDRRSVFDRFVRGRSAGPGTGLGLYLVEQVARAHGGRVDLETEEGRGSTFTLVLPVVPPTAPGTPS